MSGVGAVSAGSASAFPGAVGAQAALIGGIQAYYGAGTAKGLLVDRYGFDIVSDFSGAQRTQALADTISFLQANSQDATRYTYLAATGYLDPSGDPAGPDGTQSGPAYDSTGAPTTLPSVLSSLAADPSTWSQGDIASLSATDVGALSQEQIAALTPQQ